VSSDDWQEVDCRDVLDRVYSYLDHEVTTQDVANIREHLEACGPCLKHYDLESALKALVKRSCACEPAPVDLRVRILAQITEIRVQGEA